MLDNYRVISSRTFGNDTFLMRQIAHNCLIVQYRDRYVEYQGPCNNAHIDNVWRFFEKSNARQSLVREGN